MERLTPREQEIVRLVAEWHTSADIAGGHWISENGVKEALKRIFRKLGCRSRAQLVALLLQAAAGGR